MHVRGSMHKSRLGALVIDCQTLDLEADTDFWAAALGGAVGRRDPPRYAHIEGPEGEVKIIVQKVGHPSRVHLDIETDDVAAEVERLEGLGARRVEQVETWWVMEAPTGHRFCVVKPQRSGLEQAGNVWDGTLGSP